MDRRLKAAVLLAAAGLALFAAGHAAALSRLPLPLVSTVPVEQDVLPALSGESPDRPPANPVQGSDTAYLPFVFNRLPIVSAAVVLEDGFCCAGGTAGETIEITAAYQVHSRMGEVVEMRTRGHAGAGCLEEAELASTAWKPFSETEIFTPTLALNWVGYYVSAQFRDSAGNLSAVVCDDISLEGMPAPTP